MTEVAIDGLRTEEIGEKECQRAKAAYFACVNYHDETVGDFLGTIEREGLLENTVFVYLRPRRTRG